MQQALVWAEEHARSDFSQCGEDGLLEAMCSALGIDTGWCVEFGASNGIGSSNTHRLLMNGWKTVLIEPDPGSFKGLLENTRELPGAICINEFVRLDGDKRLDSLLAGTGAPVDIDVLSIDIDGNDYHVWESLHSFSPKIVVIEYNPSIPNDVEFVQERDETVTHGSSIRSLVQLGERKGYELAAVTELNALFVRDDLFPVLGLQDNTLDVLRDDTATKTTLFQGYDGTLMLAGNKELLWHRLPINEARLQVLPRGVRSYPGRQSPIRQVAMHAWSISDLLRSGRTDQATTGPPWQHDAPVSFLNFHVGKLVRALARWVIPSSVQRRLRERRS